MKRLMSLAKLPKSSSFLELAPDSKIPTIQAALANPDNVIHTPRILTSGAYSYVLPEQRTKYQYLSCSAPALEDLGIDPKDTETHEFRDIVSGKIYQDSDTLNHYPMPYSQAYAGWQFGQFAGQLGDGRVVNMFEVPKVRTSYDERFHTNSDKFNRSKYELQLKGAGLTPYSRFADGKAVLRSSIREYIISEHLNAIGIPTTRALALTLLPKTLARRQLPEKCAIVTRFAESWIRLGTFDLYRWRGDRNGIRKLSDYVIKNLFTVPHTKFPYFQQFIDTKPDYFEIELSDYDKMYYEIVIRNAVNAAKWQSYGFLNGVLNTDNTSILGLSMDYGPFSIMDKFDPNYTPNSEDHSSRYGYKNTPTAMWWNLTRLGEDLAELIGASPKYLSQDITPDLEEEIIERATHIIEIAGEIYTYSFTKCYVETFFNRLGLSHELIDEDPNIPNQKLVVPLLDMLEKVKCDYNMFFTTLSSSDFTSSNIDYEAVAAQIPKDNELYDEKELNEKIISWLKVYIEYLKKSEKLGFDRTKARNFNPLFLPRNWILDEVIKQTETSNGENLEYLKKLERMSFYPFDKSKWGDDLKDVEERWMNQGNVGELYSMTQCSCSS